MAWVAVAAASTWLALQRDAHLNRLVSSGSAQREWRRVLAFETILSATLRPGTRGIPEHYEFTLYVFDPRDAVLAPVWPTLSDHERSLISFPAGAGATGTAWSRRSTMSVTGTAVANGQYGLSEAQQRHFRAYRSVAATPIRFESGAMVGCLTAISKRNDGYFRDEQGGQDVLRALAEVTAVVLETIVATGEIPLADDPSNDDPDPSTPAPRAEEIGHDGPTGSVTATVETAAQSASRLARQGKQASRQLSLSPGQLRFLQRSRLRSVPEAA